MRLSFFYVRQIFRLLEYLGFQFICVVMTLQFRRRPSAKSSVFRLRSLTASIFLCEVCRIVRRRRIYFADRQTVICCEDGEIHQSDARMSNLSYGQFFVHVHHYDIITTIFSPWNIHHHSPIRPIGPGQPCGISAICNVFTNSILCKTQTIQTGGQCVVHS